MDEPLKIPEELFFVFTGRVHELSAQHALSRFTWALANQVKKIHLLIQSSGGVPGDGIAMYNFIRNAPLEVITYNSGTVASIATVVFLAGKRRIANASATFMIHKAHFSPPPGSPADDLESMAVSLRLDDRRIEGILKAETRIPEQQWRLHERQDVFFCAQEALEWGVIHEIGDYKPAQDRIVNVLPPP